MTTSDIAAFAAQEQMLFNLSLTEKQNRLTVWLEYLQDDTLEENKRARFLRDVGDIYYALADYQAAENYFQQALVHFEKLDNVRNLAITRGRFADIHCRRGNFDEALRIMAAEELPVYKRIGDEYGQAITFGKIADILEIRGKLDDALCLIKESLTIYERLGDVRSRAIAFGKIADILETRGELDEAMRIRTEEEQPVYERLGDEHSRAVTFGKIADILETRGELDEAMRIRIEEELPVYERLGEDVSKAHIMDKISFNLETHGKLEEALKIRQHEILAVYERLGNIHGLAIGQANTALLLMKFTPPRREEANQLLCLALASARNMRIPEEKTIEEALQHFEMNCLNLNSHN